ncbi:MAG: RNA methyltransferase [Bacteroidetes bacterium]|nr:RNA methyltransferase [Bacteroidota bacterium]
MTPARFEKLSAVLQRRQFDLTVVLENVFDPHNISAVMRTCDAVGVQELYILNTKIPRHKKWGARSSSSAAKWLTIHQFDNTDQCFEKLRKQGLSIITTHLDADAVPLYAMELTAPLALVFGNEHNGVSEEVRAKADGNFLIPQVGIIQSLNISVACAVTLYEAFRQKERAGHYNSPPQQVGPRLQLYKDWELE